MMMSFKSVRELSLSLVIVCCIFELAACQQCKVSSTREQFITFVRTFSTCHASNDGTAFQDEIQILNQVINEDSEFNKAGFQRAMLSEYCGDVKTCITKVTACESELSDFVKNVGTALCKNGEAVFQPIDDALNTIAGSSCDLFAVPTGVSNDGCQLGSDSAAPKTYLQHIQRYNKKVAATSRCSSRYSQAQGKCSADVIAALAVLVAASQPLENIGTSFDEVSSFAKPSFGTDRTSLALLGFMHFYKNGRRVETCKNMQDSNLLLWNTYIRIDGTGTELLPETYLHLLTDVIIQFTDDAGRVLDNYQTNSFDDLLQKKTSLQLAGDSTSVIVEDVSDKMVVLTHPGINTRIVVTRQADGLGLSLNMPTSLIDLETFGVMVEGCEMYGAALVNNIAAEGSDDCRSSCTAASSEVPDNFHDECSYDCANGVETFDSYLNAEEQLQLNDNGGAEHQTVSSLSLLFLSFLYLLS